MTITLDLPEDLAAALADVPEADRSHYAVGLMRAALHNYPEGEDEALPLRPRSAYPSDAAYITEAVRLAPSFGVDPEVAAALAEGIADAEAGRFLTLDQVDANIEAAFAARRKERERERTAA